MEQPGSGDRPEPRQEGLASRLPWRYGPPGRRQLAALAMARQRTPGGGTAAKAAGERGGYDIDDHIRLAVREESAANLGRAGGKLQAAVAALAQWDRAARAGGCDTRQALLQDAALALWEYVVHREAMGLTNHDLVDHVYGVTPELWRRMGSADASANAAASRAAG